MRIAKAVLKWAAAVMIAAVLAFWPAIETTAVETSFAFIDAKAETNLDGNIYIDFNPLGDATIDGIPDWANLPRVGPVHFGVKVTPHNVQDGIVANWQSPDNIKQFANINEDIRQTAEGLKERLLIDWGLWAIAFFAAGYGLNRLRLRLRADKKTVFIAGLCLCVSAAGVAAATQTGLVTTTSAENRAASGGASENASYGIDTAFGRIDVRGPVSEVAGYLENMIQENDRQAMEYVNEVIRSVDIAMDAAKYRTDWRYDMIVQVSDIHDNFYMAMIAAEIAKNAGARIVIDSGDLTTAGTAFENYYVQKIVGAFTSLDMTYVFVTGNHDTDETAEQAAGAGAVVLNGVAEVGGYRFAGIADPRHYIMSESAAGTGGKQAAAVAEASDALGQMVRESAEKGEPVDFAVAHIPEIGADARKDGDIRYQFSGHKHADNFAEKRDGGGVVFIANNTNGANRDLSDAMLLTGIGKPSKPITIPVYLVTRYADMGGHAINYYYEVTFAPDGTVTVSDLKEV
ncbi:MAG: metallophosphatase family protein [Clostridiales Family XIII bacterium]|jgi:predicted MPP superfamily phosphohydrolase|nr:metallophosphatase family protein [Clostridiales Family XIII bacterium]